MSEPSGANARDDRPVRGPRRRGWFFVWLLPSLWGVLATFSANHPGDEYGLFAAGSCAGLWVLWFIGSTGEFWGLFPWFAGAGLLTLAVGGLLLDLLRASRRLWLGIWLLIAAAIFFTTILGYPSLQRAIAKNGSIAAYVFFSLNFSLTIATAFTLPIAAIWRLFHRRPPPGQCQQCGYDLTGNQSGRCPECGTPCAAARPAS